MNIFQIILKRKLTTRTVLLLFLFSGCKSVHTISDFQSDGCTLFPDSVLIVQEDWCDCCFEHDIQYWQGGTEEQRSQADLAFRDCIEQKTGSEELAQIMYSGVRIGGSPYFYNWYRWGYGWDYKRKYKALSDKEKEQVAAKLEKYFTSDPDHPCEEQHSEGPGSGTP